jgi:hypothetical protein
MFVTREFQTCNECGFDSRQKAEGKVRSARDAREIEAELSAAQKSEGAGFSHFLHSIGIRK